MCIFDTGVKIGFKSKQRKYYVQYVHHTDIINLHFKGNLSNTKTL